MKRFYGEILALPRAFAREDWFIEFRLGENSHLSIADAGRCSIGPGGGKGLTLSLRVADLSEARRELLAARVDAGEIVAGSWRFPYFFVHDPEGNRIEFWSQPDG